MKETIKIGQKSSTIGIKVVVIGSIIISLLLMLLGFLPFHEAPNMWLLFTIIVPISIIISSVLIAKTNFYGFLFYIIGSLFEIIYIAMSIMPQLNRGFDIFGLLIILTPLIWFLSSLIYILYILLFHWNLFQK